MTRKETRKVLSKISSAWSTFKFLSEPDIIQDDIVDEWHAMFDQHEYAAVYRAVNSFMLDESQKFAPQAVEILRRLTAARRSLDSVCAPPSELREIAQKRHARGRVIARFAIEGETVIREERFCDCIKFRGALWPKMEFILAILGGAMVTQEIRSLGIHGASELIGNPTKAKRYLDLRDFLTELARQKCIEGGIEVGPLVPSDPYKEHKAALVVPKQGPVLDERHNWAATFSKLDETRTK